MNVLHNVLKNFSWENLATRGFQIVVILFFAFVTMKILQKLLQHLEHRLIKQSEQDGEPKSESQKRVETLVHLIKKAVLLVLWLTVGLMILKETGVEIGPILASAGVAGVAVGFGAQNLIRDVIAGFFIILENQIRVGDVAIINGTGGLVENINFRTTILRDVSGTVHVFPNGTITTLSNMTNEWSGYVFDIGIAYKENTDRVVDIMRDVGNTLRQDPKFGKLILEDPEIFGVSFFAGSSWPLMRTISRFRSLTGPSISEKKVSRLIYPYWKN
jgi:small conductance mechanosensitive channel